MTARAIYFLLIESVFVSVISKPTHFTSHMGKQVRDTLRQPTGDVSVGQVAALAGD